MPTPAKVSGNIGKHRTRGEIADRERAEAVTIPQRDKVKLRKPQIVSKDKAANKYWNSILREICATDVDLVDNLDSEVFAGFCSMLAMRDRLAVVTPELIAMTEQLEARAVADPEQDAERVINAAARALKSCEALSRSRMQLDNSILSYAEKLGLTPSGRARLAVKRAGTEEIDDDEFFSPPGLSRIG